MKLSIVLGALVVPLALANPDKCNHDNCLGNMLDSRFSTAAHLFCATIKAPRLLKRDFPVDFCGGCEWDWARVTSACACIATTTSTSTSTKKTTTTSMKITTSSTPSKTTTTHSSVATVTSAASTSSHKSSSATICSSTAKVTSVASTSYQKTSFTTSSSVSIQSLPASASTSTSMTSTSSAPVFISTNAIINGGFDVRNADGSVADWTSESTGFTAVDFPTEPYAVSPSYVGEIDFFVDSASSSFGKFCVSISLTSGTTYAFTFDLRAEYDPSQVNAKLYATVSDEATGAAQNFMEIDQPPASTTFQTLGPYNFYASGTDGVAGILARDFCIEVDTGVLNSEANFQFDNLVFASQ